MRKKAVFALLLLTASVISPIYSAYAAPEPTSVQFQVETALTGDVPSSPESFSFVLCAAGNEPMPETNTITISGSGKCSFSPITYSEPGTYLYTIRQCPGEADGYTYDESVYSVTVQVTTDDTDELKLSVYVCEKDHDGKAAEIVFSNHYSSSDAGSAEHDPGQTGTPKTNDESSPVFWFCLDGFALLCLIWILTSSIQKNRL